MSSIEPLPNNNNTSDNDATMTENTEDMGSSSQNGIDIRTALDILSARSRPNSNGRHHSNTHASAAGQSNGGCPLCAATKIPEEAKSMGQTIKLHDEDGTTNNNDEMKSEEELEVKRQALAEERSKRREEIQAKLQSMSVSELIQAVLEAQRERVATYREFDRGLDLVLQTGNMSDYPAICARATASFAVLSDTITTIQSILRPQTKPVAQLIAKLQGQERDKLNLTAALHLERIRFESSANEPDDSVRNLLQEGMQSLRAKVSVCVEQINEILEDIRMEVMDDDQE